MSMTQYTGNTEIITNIGTTPQERGLTTDQFKAKFDEALKAFVLWFNNIHLVEGNAHLANIVTDSNGVHGLKIEQGTWTPILYGSTAAGTPTYITQIGNYYKIGKHVYIVGRITISNKGGIAGSVQIGGLPFVPTIDKSAVDIGYFSQVALDKVVVLGSIRAANFISLLQHDSTSILGILDTNITNSFIIEFSGSYIA